jgi:lipopolysaccharide/colanic/teichoic acid biosynthesis glycosyltransferase
MTRLFDIIFALISIVLFAPMFLVVAILIKLESQGPIFFLQERVGKDGKVFRLIKFRSMRVGTHAKGVLITIGEDPRITRIGSFLRKYKLDELPQLYNVLVGEMSIVGPRPEVTRYVAYYTTEQRVVLSVKPGITDLASIEYRDESLLLQKQADPERYYIEHIMPEKIKLNGVFIAAPSTYNYFSIIFLTVKKIFIS